MANDDVCELLCLDVPKGEELRRDLPSLEALEVAATTVKGMSDPTRLALVHALRGGGELCVCDLGWVTGKPEKLVSHHVRLMRTAGLVRSRKDGRMVLYELTDQGRALAAVVLPEAVQVA